MEISLTSFETHRSKVTKLGGIKLGVIQPEVSVPNVFDSKDHALLIQNTAFSGKVVLTFGSTLLFMIKGRVN